MWHFEHRIQFTDVENDLPAEQIDAAKCARLAPSTLNSTAAKKREIQALRIPTDSILHEKATKMATVMCSNNSAASNK